jgi:hypothetical protein
MRFELSANGNDGNGDCDLYIRYGDRPTRLNYDYKDSNPNTNSVIIVNDTHAGNYFVGVYAYFGCNYRMRLDILGGCSTPCGDHGVCRGSACVCDEGYSGPSCSETSSNMQLNNVYTGRVAKDEWKYYLLTVDNPYAAIDVIMNQTDTNEEADCDLYARFGAPPTRFDWDYFDQNWRQQTSKVTLVEPQYGIWYIGVVGFSSCTFNIKAIPVNGCVNKCTLRGTCNQNKCNCNTQYNGTYCEEKTSPLTDGERIPGYVEYQTWNYYRVNVNSQNSLRVLVNQQSQLSDCDIYAKFNAWPSQTEYDYYDVSTAKDFNLTINDGGIGTWYFGILGISSDLPCGYNLSVSLTSSCISCVHGNCINGYCNCNPGYVGQNCDTRVRTLRDNVPMADTVGRGEWRYFSFKTNGTTAFAGLREKSTTGLIWLFANLDFAPDLRFHLYSDTDTKKSFHSLEMKLETLWSDQKEIFIGAYGSPYTNRPIEFEIVAWGTPF